MHGENLPEWAVDLFSPLDDKFGTELLEVSPERTVGRAPVEGNTQVAGLWHGGGSGLLVETLGSIAAYATAQPDRIAVGMELSVTHHAAVTKGTVTGVATPLHIGRQTCTYEVVLTDDDDRRVATGRLTCMFLPRRPGQD